MKKLLTLTAAALVATASTTASAFLQETHKRIAIDAVNYMLTRTENYPEKRGCAR